MRLITGLVLLIAASGFGCASSDGPTADDSILIRGTVTLPVFNGIDLETGQITDDATTDLAIARYGDPLHFVLRSHGARADYVYYGTTPPTAADCHGGVAQEYWIDTLPHDVYSCVYTAAEHMGYFHFATWPPFGMDSVRIGYVLWK